jgi:guanylate kinase
MQKVIAFVGPGGAGKSTQAELIRQQYDFPKPVNYATRLQRGPEDTDYRFVDKPDFAQKLIQGELRNSAIFNENLYGFHKDTFNHPQVLIAGIVPQQIVDIHGQLMKSKGELLTVFFALSDEECRERMLQR